LLESVALPYSESYHMRDGRNFRAKECGNSLPYGRPGHCFLSGTEMSAEPAILLLGRRDEPTDGVVDYCEMLRKAGARLGFSFDLAPVDWAGKGWRAAFAELHRAAAAWQDRWVLLQFTTLAWSNRGFPLRVPRVLEILKRMGARPAVVFHDFAPLPGAGIVGTVREYCHQRVLRQLYSRSELAVFPVPVNKVAWLPLRREKAIFIPVGANFPEPDRGIKDNDPLPSTVSTVAVFGITGGARGVEEVGDITYALKRVQSKGIRLRLIALGRGTEVFEDELHKALDRSGIELSVRGLMPAEELIESLASAQILLCVRGHVSSRRGSTIAGIICGLPIVGYRGAETGFPMTEAGVRLVDQHDREGLVEALAQILTDEKLFRELRQRSIAAATKYFSWDAIASQFASAISAK
jgi:glycosyltransferase involved in cell wall biosynthesis